MFYTFAWLAIAERTLHETRVDNNRSNRCVIGFMSSPLSAGRQLMLLSTKTNKKLCVCKCSACKQGKENISVYTYMIILENLVTITRYNGSWSKYELGYLYRVVIQAADLLSLFCVILS